MSPIVLLTDFGHKDWFVGVMKGVIWRISPSSSIIDYTHEISPGDIFEASFSLLQGYSYFPKGSIFCCVVDPGVGTSREAIILKTSQYFFVSPNNGLLYPIYEKEKGEIWEITQKKYFLSPLSSTFHGRDIFAPISAYLLKGIPLEEIGRPFPLERLSKLILPSCKISSSRIEGEILYFDRFGNAFLNIKEKEFLSWKEGKEVFLELKGRKIPLKKSFQEVPPYEPLFYIGSSGYLEVALNGSSLKEKWGLKRGDKAFLYKMG